MFFSRENHECLMKHTTVSCCDARAEPPAELALLKCSFDAVGCGAQGKLASVYKSLGCQIFQGFSSALSFLCINLAILITFQDKVPFLVLTREAHIPPSVSSPLCSGSVHMEDS